MKLIKQLNPLETYKSLYQIPYYLQRKLRTFLTEKKANLFASEKQVRKLLKKFRTNYEIKVEEMQLTLNGKIKSTPVLYVKSFKQILVSGSFLSPPTLRSYGTFLLPS